MNTVSIRGLLSAVVVMLTMGAVLSANAWATEPYMKVENAEGKVTTLGVEETRTQTLSMPAEGRMYIPGLSIEIACTNASGSGSIYNNYVGGVKKEGRLKSATMTFEHCGVVGKPGCYVDGAISGAGKITTNTIAARLGYQPGSTENIEALLYPEVSGKPFATITLSECALEGLYTIKGQLVAGIGPSNTFFERSIQGAITVSEIQQFNSIAFPGASETLTGQELKFGTKPASIEGALELTLGGAEKVGYFTS